MSNQLDKLPKALCVPRLFDQARLKIGHRIAAEEIQNRFRKVYRGVDAKWTVIYLQLSGSENLAMCKPG